MTLTKGDLKQVENVVYDVLGGKDLKKIRKIVREEIDDVLDEKLDTKFTEFKSQIFDHIDAFAKESKDGEEERVVLLHRVSDHTDSIEKLESAVFATV